MEKTAMQNLKDKLQRVIDAGHMSAEWDLCLESIINEIDNGFMLEERQQIEDAYFSGISDGNNDCASMTYYENTFGK